MPAPAARRRRSLTAAAYVAFALLSAGFNFATQQAVVLLLNHRAAQVLPISIVCGTLVGYVSKYVFDKNFIFYDRSETHLDETRKLLLYGVFGVLTTAIFWTAEIGSFYVFGTAEAKYVGGAVGLAIGYATKFELDRRHTFRSTGQEAP